MKYLIAAFFFLTLAGCTGKTEFGECVGISDADKDPKLMYKPHTMNIILGIIFVETIIVPVWVTLDRLYCPVEVKK